MQLTESEKKSYRLHTLAVFVWLLLLMLILFLVVQHDINQAEDEFEQYADNVFKQVSDKVNANELMAEGFSGLLSTMPEIDRKEAATYARHMLQRYPHVFMFEIAEKVPREQLAEFETKMQRNVYRDYKVRTFSYETDRKWLTVADKPIYYPITFIEPMLPGSIKVLGLDIETNSFLRKPLMESYALKRAYASQPFELAEGGRAYVLLCPVMENYSAWHASDVPERLNEYFALLVIKAEDLMANLIIPDDISVFLFHSNYQVEDTNGHLFVKQTGSRTALEETIFAKLEYYRIIDERSQPFILKLEHQIGFDDVNWLLISVITVVGFISFFTMIVFSRMHHQNQMRRLQYENKLFQLANNDYLTGLANRNMLMDRMRNVLAKSHRKQTRMAVIFIDVNDFKQVNDSYGHSCGDELLIKIAERITGVIREGDTLARYSGDEFVIMVDDVESKETVTRIIQKVHSCCLNPFHIDGYEFNVSVSVGCALYPDEAETVDSLLKLADENMYKDKQRQKSTGQLTLTLPE